VFFNNYNKLDPINSSKNANSAGIMCFTNSGGRGSDEFQIWAVYNKFYGNPHGMKIKHAGCDRLVVQGNEFHSAGQDHFQGGSHRLAFRYNVLFNSWGCQLTPNADNASGPESFGGSLFEKNTIVYVDAPNPVWMVNIQKGCQAQHGIFRDNIFAQLDSHSTRLVMRLWEYQDSWVGQEIEIDYNCYFLANGEMAKSFVVGAGGGLPSGAKNFSLWQTVRSGTGLLDRHSILEDPLFMDGCAGNLNIPPASPAAVAGSDGSFCGAFTPGKSYGVVGIADTTLLNMFQNTAPLSSNCGER
jgi:hypothetical protein